MIVFCGNDGRRMHPKEFGVFVMDGANMLRQGDLYECDCGNVVVTDCGAPFGSADSPHTHPRVMAAFQTTGAIYLSPRVIAERF